MNNRIQSALVAFVLLTAASLPTTSAQLLEQIPSPVPTSTASEAQDIFESPAASSESIDSAATDADSAEVGSILVQSSETPGEASESSVDSLILSAPEPVATSGTFSSTIEGLTVPENQTHGTTGTHAESTLATRDPFESSPVQHDIEPIPTAPNQVIGVQPTSPAVRPAYTYSTQPTYPQNTVQRRVPATIETNRQPRNMTMRVTETTTYRATPNPVRQTVYQQRYAQPGYAQRASTPARYSGGRYANSRYVNPVSQAVVVGPYGAVQAVVLPATAIQTVRAIPPRELRPFGYGGPPPGVVPVGYAGPLGPAGQIPQPRGFIPGRPLRNFVRGIAPY